MRAIVILLFATILVAGCKDKKDQDGRAAVSAGDELVKELSQRADKHPDSLALRVAVIDALDSMNRFREALSHMQLLLEKDSTNNSFWARNGQLLERHGDTTAAIESYIRSLNIYPDPNNQLYLANLLAERKDDRALLLVNSVSKTQFDDETLAHCDFIAGVYHARKGNAQLAEQLFNRCIAHNRKYMEAYMEKGFLYFERKNFEEALKIFQLATSVEPTYADAFYWQGKTQEALGRGKEALELYDQALRLDPDLKEASAAINRLGGLKG